MTCSNDAAWAAGGRFADCESVFEHSYGVNPSANLSAKRLSKPAPQPLATD